MTKGFSGQQDSFSYHLQTPGGFQYAYVISPEAYHLKGPHAISVSVGSPAQLHNGHFSQRLIQTTPYPESVDAIKGTAVHSLQVTREFEPLFSQLERSSLSGKRAEVPLEIEEVNDLDRGEVERLDVVDPLLKGFKVYEAVPQLQ